MTPTTDTMNPSDYRLKHPEWRELSERLLAARPGDRIPAGNPRDRNRLLLFCKRRGIRIRPLRMGHGSSGQCQDLVIE